MRSSVVGGSGFVCVASDGDEDSTGGGVDATLVLGVEEDGAVEFESYDIAR